LDTAFTLSEKLRKYIIWSFILLAIIRGALLFTIPLTDTTEARYAEIARKMVETNDWITPQFDYDVPFWGKPPLHTWISAAGIKLFGATPFAARIFIFLTSIALLISLFRWAKRIRGRDFALAGTLIIATNILFLVSAATVMTDLIMIVGTTLCMVGFWDNLHRKNQSLWRRYIFFLGLAIGLLAKGPVATVISALPIVLWVLINNRWIDTWKKTPWISGLAFTLLLSLPWYIAAELKTPGFLEYFIVGEHFHRFIDSGWTGDLYGHGHARTKGTIWLYALVVLLPWTPFLLAPLVSRPKKILTQIKNSPNSWGFYLLCWALSPMIFFTLATNILPTYILPGIPAVGFLVLELWLHLRTQDSAPPIPVKFFTSSMVVAILITLTTLLTLLIHPQFLAHRTQKFIIQEVYRQRADKTQPIYYWRKRHYSAEFYSQGHIKIINDLKKLDTLVSDRHKDYIVFRKKDLHSIPPRIIQLLTLEKESKKTLLFSDLNNENH